ncbi:BnaC05g19450D [Brassica napus]|uniref:BnaC05g19450D protein n=1 Tax=Brassica napus TaxID=3708 RepID=A0A078FQU4_BRANA|nr:BnaC05g19450D [Brassica napus]
MLAESQFRLIMLMGGGGGGYTFSYELWCRFAGKAIRYAIGDFAVVTGLNCGT